MKRSTRSPRLLLAAVVALLAAWPLAQLAHAGPSGPTVPPEIQVEEGHKVFLVGHAVGVQIYLCNGDRWGFVAPSAVLYDDHGKEIIRHYGGPTWQAKDGSLVQAQVVEPRVTVDPTAIPWLRLKATLRLAGADGDRLAGTTFIQRVATTGGLAPAPDTCNEENAWTFEDVEYTADYYFWKAIG